MAKKAPAQSVRQPAATSSRNPRPRAATEKDRTEAVAAAPLSAEEQTAAAARRGEARVAEKRAEAQAKVEAPKSAKRGAGETESGVPQARSGGPLHADPTKPPVNSKGETPVHPPDLADNPPGKQAAARGAFGGFPPMPITAIEDVDEIVEKIRTTEKADVLYAWIADEKASAEPRQEVIDACLARLNYVQGPPLPPV